MAALLIIYLALSLKKTKTKSKNIAKPNKALGHGNFLEENGENKFQKLVNIIYKLQGRSKEDQGSIPSKTKVITLAKIKHNHSFVK